MIKRKINISDNLKHDFPASIIVFLVAVPLCLGIALASGAPLFSGIIAGFVGGIVVTLFSGSSLGVSGPAAGLVAIVVSSIHTLGSFNAFLLAVVIAGIIQLILGYAKAGIIGYYFPSSVIKGMLTGIGIIIVLKQIPHSFGYDKDYEGDLDFIQPDGHNTFSELYYMLNYISPGAVVITVVSLAILILWEQSFIKRNKVFQLVQGPLVVVIAGILLNLLFQSTTGLQLKPDQIVSLPIPGNFTDFLGQFTFPDFSQIMNMKVYVVALTLAIVASIETLLSVEAIDKLDPHKRITPTNRELKAQGVGNLISGLIGGLPVTQVIVRSSANVQSGGRTKSSAFFHGVILLISAALIPGLLNLIPLSSLAAILLLVGYKLAKPSLFKEMYRTGKTQFIPFIVTILGIIFTDLLIGIGLGLTVGVFYILYNSYKTPYFFNPENHVNGNQIDIVLSENVTFLHKAGIMQTLNHLPENSKVTIDASNTANIDYDILEIIEDFKQNALHKNIDLEVKGIPVGSSRNQVEKFSKTIREHSLNQN